MEEKPTLKRTLSLPFITFYGLGTIIGAGIYVLVGEVAGKAGLFAPRSFLLASITAFFTAVSFAELSARAPKSAGQALYVEIAFRRKSLSFITGMLVVFVVITSSATLANGFASYFRLFIPAPLWLIIIFAVLSAGLLASWGIKEAVAVAAVATVIEIIGLLIIIFVSGDSLTTLPERLPELIPDLAYGNSAGIFMGSFLAFFAFIGFEDIVNVAEEVKAPQRNLPLGIFLSPGLSALLYILVSLTAVLSLPLSELAGNATPSLLSTRRIPGGVPS